MPQLTAGQPWQGLEYNERLSPRITRGLGLAMLRATVEAARHPGLNGLIQGQVTYADAPSLQQLIRPALMIQPSQRAAWGALLGVEIGEGIDGN